MQDLNKDQFVDYYYRNNSFPNGISCTKKNYNEKEINTKFRKYKKLQLKKQDKFENSVDLKWQALKEYIIERDQNKCRLYQILTQEEKDSVFDDLVGIMLTLDGAHVLSRARRPDLKYDFNNVVLLHRLFHSRIDSFCNPITGENMSEEERISWWERIVGEEYYKELGY